MNYRDILLPTLVTQANAVKELLSEAGWNSTTMGDTCYFKNGFSAIITDHGVEIYCDRNSIMTIMFSNILVNPYYSFLLNPTPEL